MNDQPETTDESTWFRRKYLALASKQRVLAQLNHLMARVCASGTDGVYSRQWIMQFKPTLPMTGLPDGNHGITGDCPVRFLQARIVGGSAELHYSWELTDVEIQRRWRSTNLGLRPAPKHHETVARKIVMEVAASMAVALVEEGVGYALADADYQEIVSSAVKEWWLRTTHEDPLHHLVDGVAETAYGQAMVALTTDNAVHLLQQFREGLVTNDAFVDQLPTFKLGGFLDLSGLTIDGLVGDFTKVPTVDLRGTILRNCNLQLCSAIFNGTIVVNSTLASLTIDDPLENCSFNTVTFHQVVMKSPVTNTRFHNCSFIRSFLEKLDTRRSPGALVGSVLDTSVPPTASNLDAASAAYLRIAGHAIDQRETW